MTVLPLAGKSLVVVGGTTGLGLSAASAFVAAGGRVAVMGRSAESLAAALGVLGGSACGCAGDATDPDAVARLFAVAAERHGGIDGLYHVAGGSGRRMGDGPLHEISDEGWRYTIDLNLTSVMISNRAAVRHFLAAGRPGSILNMGSVLGWSPSPRYFATHAYAATKAAIVGFTKTCAAYYAKDGIRFNVLAPALVETPMARRAAGDEEILAFIRTKQPLDGGRIGVPADLDAAAVYFMGDGSKFATGQVLAVDGGWCVSEGQTGEGA